MAFSTGPLNSSKPTTSVITGAVYNKTTPAPGDKQVCALQCDDEGNLLVNAVLGGGGVSPAVGPNGSPIPADSILIGSEDASGNLQPASAANPIPVAGSTSITSNIPVQTTVTNISSLILALNAGRKEVTIVNTGVVPVYLGLGQIPSATAYHIVLSPCVIANDGTGGTYTSDMWKGAINAIVASTSGTVCITELT